MGIVDLFSSEPQNKNWKVACPIQNGTTCTYIYAFLSQFYILKISFIVSAALIRIPQTTRSNREMKIFFCQTF